MAVEKKNKRKLLMGDVSGVWEETWLSFEGKKLRGRGNLAEKVMQYFLIHNFSFVF
jgi:hypothetical protein